MSTQTHTAPTWRLNARGARLKARVWTAAVAVGWLIAGALAVWMTGTMWTSMVLASDESTGPSALMNSYAVSISAAIRMGVWRVFRHELVQIARHARAAARSR